MSLFTIFIINVCVYCLYYLKINFKKSLNLDTAKQHLDKDFFYFEGQIMKFYKSIRDFISFNSKFLNRDSEIRFC